MRDGNTIAREIEHRGCDLASNVSELKTLLDDKLGAVKRARSNLELRRDRLLELRDGARSGIRRHPWFAVVVAINAGALLGLLRRR